MFKVLIVDDEKIIRTGIKNVIPWVTLKVSEVYTAASGREALELVKQYAPDLIITDISMGEMSGLVLIEEIRKFNRECRIIVLTGYDRFDYARKALQLSAQDFLLKPVEEEALAEAVEKQLQELEELHKKREADKQAVRAKGVSQQTCMERYLSELLEGNENHSLREDFFRTFSFPRDMRMRIGILLPDILAAESNENRFFRLLTIKNICMGMLDEQNCGLTFNYKGGSIIAVLFMEKLGVEPDEQIRDFVELLERESGSRVRFILGSEQSGFHNLHISYNDAVYVMESERENWRSVVKVEWEQKREQMFLEIYQEFKQSIMLSLDHEEQLFHIYRRFLQALESYNVSDSYGARCCFEIVSSVYFVLMRSGNVTLNEGLDGLLQSISGADRLIAGQVTMNFLEKLYLSGPGKNHDVVRRVKQLISENLGKNISVASLAAEVYVSANYLSRIFKQAEGEGCNEYIVRKRMEKARLLLQTTTLKAGEIAPMVGYQDINYFSLSFKRNVGVSPTKYRETIFR